MEGLFPIVVNRTDIPDVPGLSYIPEYISDSLEQELVQAIDAEPWDISWQRRRQPYGSNYGSKEAAAAIPSWGARHRWAEEGYLA